MNRRNFLRAGTLFLTAPTLAKLSTWSSSKSFAMEPFTKDFSIELITDNAEKAIPLVEKLIKENFFTNGIIKYSEFEMTGSQKGDIVFFKNSKLINYKESQDKISGKIREISNELNLPKIVENSSLLRFYSQTSQSKASQFLVTHNGTVIEEIVSCSNTKSINLNGTHGKMNIQIRDYKLSVTESPCQHKTCIKSGCISKSGENLVCIPNEIVIMAV